MTRICAALFALVLALSALTARAAEWKMAPNAEKQKDQSKNPFAFDFQAPEFEADWMNSAMLFLSENYGYFGVAFVLLALFLFGRGSGPKTAGRGVEEMDDDEDYFEPADYRRYDDQQGKPGGR